MDQPHSSQIYFNAITIVLAVLALFPVVSAWRKSRRDDILKQLDDPKDRPSILITLQATHPPFERYVEGVVRLDRRLRHWFGPSWEIKAFGRCFQFSFVYPIVFLFLSWSLGASGSVGEITLLPEMKPESRLVTVTSVVIITLCMYVFFWRAVPDILGGRLAAIFGAHPKKINHAGKMYGDVISFVFSMCIFFALINLIDSVFVLVGIFAFNLAAALTGALNGVVSRYAFVTVLSCMLIIGYNMGQKATLLAFVFFLILPLVNALIDFVSWGATRALLTKFHSQGSSIRSPAWIAGAIFLDLLIAIACLAGLCVLMALFLEALNQIFLWRGISEIDWRGQVALAVEYPVTKGILVTGMLVTTLIPTMFHIAVGLEHAFTAPTPDTHAAAALIKDDMSTGDKQRVADVVVARDWYLYPCFAFAAVLVLALAALIGLGAAPLGLTLADIAYCSASLIDGPCPWTD